MNMRWRASYLVQAIPIPRGDLNQAISRDDFRPEHAPEPGKGRWYSWRDVVAIAVAQELRNIGYGPSMAFQLVQEHLSQFLRASVDQPGDCAGVLWLIYTFEDRLRKTARCEFVQQADGEALLIASNESACVIVNVGRIANRILNELQALALADVEALTEALVRAEAEAEARHQATSSL